MNLANGKKVFTLQYYKDGFTGWSKSSRTLWIIGILIQLIIGLHGGITPIGLTSTIAGIIGFSCTLAVTNGKAINGLLGFVSALMFVYVAIFTGNYSDVIMQMSYIVLLDIPIMFSNNWNNKEFKARKLNNIQASQFFFLFLIFFAACFFLDTQILHSHQAFLDALSAAIGLTGAVMCVNKFRAQYYMWTLGSFISIALWIQTAMHGHPVWVLMVTYMLYFANDMIAFFNSKWFKK